MGIIRVFITKKAISHKKKERKFLYVPFFAPYNFSARSSISVSLFPNVS